MEIIISLSDKIEDEETLNIYRENNWSSAEKPELLLPALRNSHSLVTARINGELVGIGNAISDGYLVVYFPHMLVHPKHQRKGIGKKMMEILKNKYLEFHQQMLTSDSEAIKFYENLGFVKAGNTESMWIYEGKEH